MDVINVVNYVSCVFIQVTCDMQLTDYGPYQRSQANGLFTSNVSVTVDVSIDPLEWVSRSSSKRHCKRYTQVFPKYIKFTRLALFVLLCTWNLAFTCIEKLDLVK